MVGWEWRGKALVGLLPSNRSETLARGLPEQGGQAQPGHGQWPSRNRRHPGARVEADPSPPLAGRPSPDLPPT